MKLAEMLRAINLMIQSIAGPGITIRLLGHRTALEEGTQSYNIQDENHLVKILQNIIDRRLQEEKSIIEKSRSSLEVAQKHQDDLEQLQDLIK